MRTGERVILQGCGLCLSEQLGRRSLDASHGKQRTVWTSFNYPLLYIKRLKDAGLLELRLMAKDNVFCRKDCPLTYTPLLNFPSPFHSSLDIDLR